MEILHVYIIDAYDWDNYIEAVEDDTVNFDVSAVGFSVRIRNNGAGDNSTVTLKDTDENVLEEHTQYVDENSEVSVSFDNDGNYYFLPDGETKTWIFEVTP